MKKLRLNTTATVRETFENYIISRKARGVADETLRECKSSKRKNVIQNLKFSKIQRKAFHFNRFCDNIVYISRQGRVFMNNKKYTVNDIIMKRQASTFGNKWRDSTPLGSGATGALLYGGFPNSI